jgi:hypothetical protein
MFKQLGLIRENGGGRITYIFADGSKTASDINGNIFLDEKGRRRKLDAVMDIFQSTAHDMRAVSFEF